MAGRRQDEILALAEKYRLDPSRPILSLQREVNQLERQLAEAQQNGISESDFLESLIVQGKFEQQTVAELRAIADSLGLTVSPTATRAQLLAAIQAAQNEDGGEGGDGDEWDRLTEAELVRMAQRYEVNPKLERAELIEKLVQARRVEDRLEKLTDSQLTDLALKHELYGEYKRNELIFLLLPLEMDILWPTALFRIDAQGRKILTNYSAVFTVIQRLGEGDQGTVELVRDDQGREFTAKKYGRSAQPPLEILQQLSSYPKCDPDLQCLYDYFYLPAPPAPRMVGRRIPLRTAASVGPLMAIFEYIPGKTISAMASQFQDDPSRLLVLFTWLGPVLEKLRGAGYVHGDLHWENILVLPDETFRLIDFDKLQPITSGEDTQVSRLLLQLLSRTQTPSLQALARTVKERPMNLTQLQQALTQISVGLPIEEPSLITEEDVFLRWLTEPLETRTNSELTQLAQEFTLLGSYNRPELIAALQPLVQEFQMVLADGTTYTEYVNYRYQLIYLDRFTLKQLIQLAEDFSLFGEYPNEEDLLAQLQKEYIDLTEAFYDHISYSAYLAGQKQPWVDFYAQLLSRIIYDMNHPLKVNSSASFQASPIQPSAPLISSLSTTRRIVPVTSGTRRIIRPTVNSAATGGRRKRLPILSGEDKVQRLRASWSQAEIVRIQAIGDGNCFFHGLLKSIYQNYQNQANVEERISLGESFRASLGNALLDPYLPRQAPSPALLALREQYQYLPRGQVYDYVTNYEGAGNGVLLDLFTLRDESPAEDEEELDYQLYSLEAITAVLYSKSWVGEELLGFIADMCKIDLFVMHLFPEEIETHIDTLPGNITFDRITRPVVILGNNGCHYEVIGIRTPAGLQTNFDGQDEFLRELMLYKVSQVGHTRHTYDSD